MCSEMEYLQDRKTAYGRTITRRWDDIGENNDANPWYAGCD